MDFLTSPWFIITIVMAFLIGNIAAFKYISPKHLDKLTKPKNDQLDRLIELDKKHHQQLQGDKSRKNKKDE